MEKNEKALKDKAIKIQGKDYVLVGDRIIYFNDTYNEGSIETEIIEMTENSVLMKTTVYPDKDKIRKFTGYSQEVNDGKNFINKTSMIENAETSAVGRALAMMGIGVIDSIASVDEIKKAKNSSFNEKIIGNYYCTKCGVEHKGVELLKGNYGPYFKCNECGGFSTNKKPLRDGVDFSELDF